MKANDVMMSFFPLHSMCVIKKSFRLQNHDVSNKYTSHTMISLFIVLDASTARGQATDASPARGQATQHMTCCQAAWGVLGSPVHGLGPRAKHDTAWGPLS